MTSLYLEMINQVCVSKSDKYKCYVYTEDKLSCTCTLTSTGNDSLRLGNSTSLLLSITCLFLQVKIAQT